MDEPSKEIIAAVREENYGYLTVTVAQIREWFNAEGPSIPYLEDNLDKAQAKVFTGASAFEFVIIKVVP